MKTYKRICIKDYSIQDSEGTTFKVERGKEYITSEIAVSPSFMAKELQPEDGHVTVFSTYWVKVPVSIFAGEEVFTP